MKGDRVIECREKRSNRFLLIYILWYRDGHFCENLICNSESVGTYASIAMESHKCMPSIRLEEPIEVAFIDIMRSENIIQRRHSTGTTKLITFYRTKWRTIRNARVINEIIWFNQIIPVNLIAVCNIFIEEILLRNNPIFCGVCENLVNYHILIFSSNFLRDFSELTLFPSIGKSRETDLRNSFPTFRKHFLKQRFFEQFHALKLTLMKGDSLI